MNISMRSVDFVDGEYYHVFNRGVEKRQIFVDDCFYERFLESMYLFNDALYVHSPDWLQRVSRLAASEVAGPDRKPFVNVVAYCLMPNHYHLLLQQLQEGGVSRFMHKVNMGYSKFFNIKNERAGTLYESPFKAVPVDSEAHLLHLPLYIHLNALDLTGLSWRDGRVTDWNLAVDFLDAYKWSSHAAYMGRGQYLPIISSDHVGALYKDTSDYLAHLKGWSGRELQSHLANISDNYGTW